ncbi:MAG: arsenic efflux protein, partial [Clostridia bacterium]|nr:arsenic efflux protein [Clostridia bacterium]
ITLFIFLVSLVLDFIIEFIGNDALANFITNKPVIGELVAGLIGLIPNCAASVVITQLYLEGALSFGAMMSGLLVGAGIGIAVLLRMNKDIKKNIQIIAILYGYGVIFGIIIELLGR